MSTIKFTHVDALPESKVSTGAPGAYLEVFEYLRANPGKAVKLDGRPWVSVAARINGGGVKGCEPGEFAATTRGGKDGRADIYVTYIGPKPNEDYHERTVAL